MPDFSGNKAICCPGFVRLGRPAVRRAARFCMSLAVILLGGPEAWAETRVPADSHIARLNHAGFKTRGYCTGFATQEGPVITAAHCLPEIPTDIVHVLLGYETGQLEQHIKTPATSYRIMPGHDIAALCDIKGDPNGLRLTDASPTPGTRVEVQGYGAPSAHALQKTACSVLSLPLENLMQLDCPLPPGTSGAPVTLTGSRDVVGVVSASSTTGSFAYLLSVDMTERLCKDDNTSALASLSSPT